MKRFWAILLFFTQIGFSLFTYLVPEVGFGLCSTQPTNQGFFKRLTFKALTFAPLRLGVRLKFITLGFYLHPKDARVSTPVLEFTPLALIQIFFTCIISRIALVKSAPVTST